MCDALAAFPASERSIRISTSIPELHVKSAVIRLFFLLLADRMFLTLTLGKSPMGFLQKRGTFLQKEREVIIFCRA
jgi:hypothetical protein